MFSLGSVLYRLAYNGTYPYYDQKMNFNTISDYFTHLETAELKFPRYPKRSKEFEHMIQKMLRKDPADRLDWPSLFEMDKIKQDKTNHSKEEEK